VVSAGKQNIIALTITNFYRQATTMDIETLRTFLAVVRTRHFGRAAEELCITQSAVSARIRQLESTLGMPLFTRQRNDIQLTTQGLQLLKHAETIVHAWARARQETGLRETFTAGLAVGAAWDLWETLLDGWLFRLQEGLPEMALQAEAGAMVLLIRRLMDGVIDLAIVFEPPQVPGLEIRELGVIRLVLAATKRHIPVKQAVDAGYIIVDYGAAFALNHARHFPDMPAPALRMNHGAMARRHLDQADGAAYLPEQMLEAPGGRRLYRVSKAPVIERPVFAVYRSGTEREDRIRQVLRLL
jgi:DNA-binding transcriptional LysR family regulator